MPATINSLNGAIKRVRLLLDKSDSPYTTTKEIIRFLQISVTEYIQERLDLVGSSQQVRDELGGSIREVSYISPSWNVTTGLNQGNFVGPAGDNYMQLYGNLFFWIRDGVRGNNAVRIYIAPSSSTLDFSGTTGDLSTVVPYNTTGDEDDNTTMPILQGRGTVDFAHLISITIKRSSEDYKESITQDVDGVANEYTITMPYESNPIYTPVKITELDDLESILNDPFNKPTIDEPRAVRKGNYYEIYPSTEFINENVAHQTGLRPNIMRIVVTYVMLDASFMVNPSGEIEGDNLSNRSITRFPNQSREEICNIAARKIMAVLADERYNAASVETQEMRK